MLLENNNLTFVIAPGSDHIDCLNLEGLVTYLNKNSDFNINLSYCHDYAEAIEALTDGKAQIGWLGPYACIEASRSGAVEQFAIGLPKGKQNSNYQSVFIVRSSSDIKSLCHVKNKKIVVGDHHSTSGYAIPKKELAEVGIHLDNLNDFQEVINAHTHDDAIRCVIDGSADVAPVSSVNLEENISSGKLDPNEIRIIHKSKDIPGAPLVYSKFLPSEIKEHLRELVLSAHKTIEVGGYGGDMERYIDPEQGKRDLFESYLERPQWGWRSFAFIALTLLMIGLVGYDLDIDLVNLLVNSTSYLTDIFGRMVPPDFSGFQTLMSAMLETVEIAFLGTVIAIALSIPIGLLSARNIAPNFIVFIICRGIIVFFRAVPEFIMAMILVIAIGFGAMPGILALGLHTMGFLAKFYAEDIEHVDTGPIEALESIGASTSQRIAFAIVPQVLTSFIGYNLYIFDRNIRMATMLGIVGAGGIGYELQSAFRMFNYPRVSAIIIIIFIVIFAIDMLSSIIRKHIN